jgi:hypothetical protein
MVAHETEVGGVGLYDAAAVVSHWASEEGGAESDLFAATTTNKRNGNTAPAMRIRGFRLVRGRFSVMKGRFE